MKDLKPVIVSASRATDIPAFYSGWLFERLKKGHLIKVNPYNQRPSKVSLNSVKFIVFWTKNPKPMIENLSYLDERGIRYYFQYTLNDYEREGYEKNVPPLSERISTFKELSDKIGKEKVIWRFDPLILSDNISVDTLLKRIENIGDQIAGYTERMVFSFIDLYKSVEKNLGKSGFSDVRVFTTDEMTYFAGKLKNLNQKWKLELFTCSEELSLTEFGINKSRCIDPGLIGRICADSPEMTEYLLDNSHKDKNQRALCGCMPATDIGHYNTCIHLCSYCYANRNQELAMTNYRLHMKDPHSERLVPL